MVSSQNKCQVLLRSVDIWMRYSSSNLSRDLCPTVYNNLKSIDWNSLFNTTNMEPNINDIKNPNYLYDVFTENFGKVFNDAFPLVSTFSKTKRNCNPWITPALIKCCQVKSKLYKRYKNVVSRTKYKNYAKK